MIKTIEQWVCDLCGTYAQTKNGEAEDGKPTSGGWKEFVFREKKDDVTYVETHQICGKCIQQLVENQISAKAIN